MVCDAEMPVCWEFGGRSNIVSFATRAFSGGADILHFVSRSSDLAASALLPMALDVACGGREKMATLLQNCFGEASGTAADIVAQLLLSQSGKVSAVLIPQV